MKKILLVLLTVFLCAVCLSPALRMAAQSPAAPTASGAAPAPGPEGQTPNAEAQTPNAEAQTPYAEGQTPNAEAQTPYAEGQTPYAEGQTPYAEGQTPYAEGQTPYAEGQTPYAEGHSPFMEIQTPPPAARPRTEEESGRWLAAYQPVLDTYRRFLSGEEIEGSEMTERDDYYLLIGETGISFLSRYGGTLGYCLKDLNRDGVPELLISAEGAESYSGLLHDLFTLADGKPRRVLVSSERVRYALCGDGLILYEGSGGASLNLCCLYELSGPALRVVDAVVMEDQSFREIRENRAQLFERAESDVPISEERYRELSESWRASVVEIAVTPFA